MILFNFFMFIIILFFLIEFFFGRCTVCQITNIGKTYDVVLIVHFNFFCACKTSNFLFTKTRSSEPNLNTRKNFGISALMMFIFIHFSASRFIIFDIEFHISEIFVVIAVIFRAVSIFSYIVISFENIVFMNFSFIGSLGLLHFPRRLISLTNAIVK